MREVASRLFQQLFNILHRLLRLRPRVAEANQIAGEIGANLAANVDGIAGPHRLAQIVVQRLVRVGLFGVKHANTGMSWHQSTP